MHTKIHREEKVHFDEESEEYTELYRRQLFIINNYYVAIEALGLIWRL